MAKYVLNAGLREVRGTIDGWVYKHYRDKRGCVLSRRPDMSKVKPTAAQKAQRKRMQDAAKFYQQVKSDAQLLAMYRRLAKKLDVTLPAAVASDFFKRDASAPSKRR